MYNHVNEIDELMDIPFDNYFLIGVSETMGTMPTSGDIDDLHYDPDTGDKVEWTEEQIDAFDDYEQGYYRFMDYAQTLIEAFGYVAPYGIN